MVGPGEVDEDLEGETKEECEKYGKVVKCVIFEVSENQLEGLTRLSYFIDQTGQTHFPLQIADVPEEDAVRIFLEFERVESAIKGWCFLIYDP